MNDYPWLAIASSSCISIRKEGKCLRSQRDEWKVFGTVWEVDEVELSWPYECVGYS